MKLLIMHLSPPLYDKWKISNLYSQISIVGFRMPLFAVPCRQLL